MPVVKHPPAGTVNRMPYNAQQKNRRQVGHTIAGLIAGIFATLILVGCGEKRSEPIQFDATSTTSTADTTVEESGTDMQITIVIDGWSKAGITESSLTWSDGAEKRTALQWRAVDVETLKEIATEYPEVPTRLAARMYSADPYITCGPDKCQDSTGDIEYEALVDPTTSPVHGALYEAWGIRTGAWIATIPAETATLWFGTQALEISRSNEIPEFTPEGVQAAGEVIAITVSFGTIHPIAPAWLVGTPATVSEFGSVEVDTSGGYSYTSVPAEKFLRGVHSEVVGASNIGASRLTWMTSPTTGCGGGTICVPGAVATEITADTPTVTIVCSGSYTGVLERGAVRVSYTYPQIVHQYGIWGGAQSSISTESGIPLWNTTPPYVSGPMEMIFEYAHLYDQIGIYGKVGYVRTVGEDASPVEWFPRWGQC